MEETAYSETESPYLRVHTLMGTQSSAYQTYQNNELDKNQFKKSSSNVKQGQRVQLLTK